MDYNSVIDRLLKLAKDKQAAIDSERKIEETGQSISDIKRALINLATKEALEQVAADLEAKILLADDSQKLSLTKLRAELITKIPDLQPLKNSIALEIRKLTEQQKEEIDRVQADLLFRLAAELKDMPSGAKVIMSGGPTKWSKLKGSPSDNQDLVNYIAANGGASTLQEVTDNGATTTVESTFSSGIITKQVEYDLVQTGSPTEGQTIWNSNKGLLEVGLAHNFALEVGQQLVCRVVNKTGSTLSKHKIVYINGGEGNRPTVTLADNSTEATSSKTFAVLTANIANNGNGWAIVTGTLYNVNTSSYSAGATLYLGTSGNFTATKPVAPANMVAVAKVVNVHATEGVLQIEVQNGFELGELHDVLITSPSNGQVLAYEASSGLWKNQATPAAGTTGNVQYNTSGALDADTYFNYDESAKRLEVYGALGTEKVSNGNFTGGAAGWTVGTGWAYSSNTMTKNSNGTGTLSQSITFILGEINTLSITVSAMTVSSFTITCGGVTLGTITANGTYTYKFVPISTASLVLTPTNTSRFTVDNISIKRLQDGQISTGTLAVGGVVTDTTTTKAKIFSSQSNGNPDTTRALMFENAGTNTWIDFSFSGITKVNIGTNSVGELQVWSSGSSGMILYSKVTGSYYSYNTPTEFVHTGRAQFTGKVHAGVQTPATSTLQSAGSTALRIYDEIVTSNITLGDYTKYIVDASDSEACTGTPSNACSSYVSQGTCEANDSHGGCTWNAGSSCSAFDNESGMTTCSSTSGCTTVTAACSGSDESTCLAWDDAYGGSCSWGATGDCSALSEGSCSSYSGCTANYFDCSTLSGNESSCSSTSGCSVASGNTCPSQGDETSCLATSGCSWNGSSCDGDNSVCSGNPYLNCSGTYNACSGTYNTGSCTGTYGAACSGTASCSGINDSTSCEAESGCTWSAILTLQLPDGTGCPNRDYWIYKNSATGTVRLIPYSGQQVDFASSYDMTADKQWLHISYKSFNSFCSDFDGNEAGCNANLSCTWNSEDNTCSGTYPSTRNWFKFGS